MSGLNRRSTGDLKAAAGRDPSKPRPSSATPGPSSAPLPSSIPRPASYNRQTSTPTRPTSYRNEVNTNSNNQNNTETTGVGFSVGLGLGGLSRASRPSPPGPVNGRNSATLRRSTSAQSKFPGRPSSSVTATGSPARIPVPSNRKKRLKEREGSQDGTSSSSASSSEMESDTTAKKGFGENKESHPFNARELYVTIFNKYDPAGTGSVAVRDVVAILRELEEGFGCTTYSILSADGEMAVRTAMEEAPSLTLSQSEFEVMVRKMLGFGLIDRLTELQSTNTGQEEQLANRQPSPPNIDTSASKSPTFEGVGSGLIRSPRLSPRRSPSRAGAQEDSIFDALHNSPRSYAEGSDSVGDDSTGFIGGPPIDSVRQGERRASFWL